MTGRYDAIVIGSGLGGLTAAALYARAGRKVLVLERNEHFGGAATVCRHGALAIEASLHEIDVLDAHDPKWPLLRALGLDRDIAFVDVGDLFEVRSPLLGDPFALPRGVGAAREAARERFPRQARGIDGYFDRIVGIHDAVAMAAEHLDDCFWWLWHAPTLPWRLWPLIRDRHATVSEAFRRLFGDDEGVKLALAPNLGYYTDDPDVMPFIAYAFPQASYLAGGGHYIRGGSQILSGRLVALIREAGGEVEAGREAEKLLLKGGSVTGVGHRARHGGDAREDLAPVVFGNAAPSVLAEMLPEAQRDIFFAPYRGRRLSVSLWTIALGLSRPSRDVGLRHYSTFIAPSWMTTLRHHREAGAILGADPGARMPPYMFVAYDQIGSGLNEGGPYLSTLCGIDRMENWAGLDREAKRARKERWLARLIADLDTHYPGIAGIVVQREMATAETFHHYLNTPGGALYGFSPEARSSGFGLVPKTAIPGLYLASAFTGGGGFTGAMMGGAWAARAAMKAEQGSPALHPAPR